MGKLKTFTRRAFLVGSVAVAGGVAFGTYQVARPSKNPLAPEDGTTLNPWVIIDGRGVTIIVPRAEMGQGVQTTLAALVAEEMHLEITDIRVEHGPPAEAYANTALIADRGYGAEPRSGIVKSIADAMPKLMKMQVTGGSTSTMDAFDKMRRAGAAAREVLELAGADRMHVGIDQVRAEAGFIIATDGTKLSYSELAEDAARLVVPDAPRLTRPEDWRLLGKSLPRLDQLPKATGTETYSIDLRLPGMRFATVKMNPRLGGEMRAFDPAPALAMAGVERVVDLGTGFAVVATNTWLAMQAAEAVTVDWGPAPYPADTDGIFAAIEAAFDSSPNVVGRDSGNPDRAEGSAHSARYHAPYLAHATMEPMGATALYTGEALEIWAGNQAPVMLRDAAAKAVDLPKDAVTVHSLVMGGGFGRRSYMSFGAYAAKVAAAMPGVPVQVTWSREEDMTHDHYRPGALARMSAKLTGQGAEARITALTADLAAPSLMAQTMEMMGLPFKPSDRTIVEGAADQPYEIGAALVRGYAADVAVPVGFWRSVGASQNAFFFESFIDELAASAGADPVAFRLAHVRPLDEPSAQVIEKVAEMCGWTGKTPDGVGRGIAFTHSFGTPVAEVVEVVEEDGLIRLSNVWIAADPGLVLDPRNVEAQLSGGALFGLSAAIFGEITFADGAVEQQNFPDYDGLRMPNAPRVTVGLVDQGAGRPQGVGEPGTPPAAPALANALFDLTGKRPNALPLMRVFDFLT